MVSQKLIVTCSTCGSKDVSFTKSSEVLEKRQVTDFSLDHRWWSESKIRNYLKCHCNKCGRNFEENLGVEYIPLAPGYIEV